MSARPPWLLACCTNHPRVQVQSGQHQAEWSHELIGGVSIPVIYLSQLDNDPVASGAASYEAVKVIVITFIYPWYFVLIDGTISCGRRMRYASDAHLGELLS